MISFDDLTIATKSEGGLVMSLSDLLVELSEPEKAEEFVNDPEAVMARAGLSEADKAALRSREWGWIDYQARGNFTDPTEYVKGTIIS